MARVTFATISELNKDASPLVKEAEKTNTQVVITKRGKPVGLLRKVMASDRGRTETVTNMINRANELLSSIEKGHGPVIVTRKKQRIVILKSISSKAFSIKE